MHREKITTNAFKKLLLVQILAIIAATIGSMVDGIVIGNFLGVTAMAAFGVASPAFIILAAFSGIFSSGAQTLCGKLMGKGDSQGVNRVFSITCLMLIISGVLITALVMIFAEPIAKMLGASDALVTMVADYLRGLSVGIIGIISSSTLMAFMQLDGDPIRSFVSVLVMTAANIALDLANVYIFDGGMFGMALATSISYYASIIVILFHFRKGKSTLKPVLKGLQLSDIKDVFVIGIPSAISRICTVFRTMFLNYLLMFIAGEVAVAALSIQNSLASLISAVGIGIGMTTLLVSSIVVGEEDRKSLSVLIKFTVKLGFILTAIVSVVVFIFARPLASMFGAEDATALELAGRAISLYAISIPFNTINIIFMNYFQSIRNLKMTNFICIFDNVVLMIIFSLSLTPLLGSDGVWISFLIAEVAMLIIIGIVAMISSHHLPKKIEDFLMIPDSFGVDEEHRFDVTVNSMDEVMTLSESVDDFCKRFDIDHRRTMLLSLCIEEMAGNIVEYGFNDNKPHTIDIRLIYKDDELILKMRDDCKPFNPKEQNSVFNPQDPCSNIGIRMISKMAKEMEYRNTLNINNLSLKI